MMNKTNPFRIIGIIVSVLIFVSACGKSDYVYLDSTGKEVSEDTEETKEQSVQEQKDETATETGCCYIYVCGQVVNPGVYQLAPKSRICDAIDAAGGMTALASESYWNLAQEICDGEMIYVPSEEEAQEYTVTETVSDGKIDLNQATKEQLMSIPGVGEAKAQSIIAYREKNGSFSSKEEVMNISGIKEGLYSKMEEYIVVR